MTYKISEKKAHKKLGIEGFDQLPKEKNSEFAYILPFLDKEVAKRALEQIPNFNDTACELVRIYNQLLTEVVKSCNDTDKACIDACNNVLEVLSDILKQGNLSPELFDKTEDNIFKVLEMMMEINALKKKFQKQLYLTFGVTIIFSLILMGILLLLLSHFTSNQDLVNENEQEQLDDEAYDDDDLIELGA